MKKSFLTLSILLLSSLSLADIRWFNCKYEYAGETFMYHIIMTRYHDPSGQISLSQSVEPKYVIFDSENKPMSIKGNPIFEIEFYGKDSQGSPFYDGSTFRVGWDDAYIGFIEYIDSPCEDDPDYWK